MGSAGSYRGFVLVDQPLPWPRDAALVEELQPVVALVSGAGLRLQLVVPEAAAEREVAVYRAVAEEEGWFAPLRRARVVVEESGDGAVATAVEQALLAPPRAVSEPEVLVCTHGRRDVCCGSLGTELYLELGSSSAPARVRRTSHTGGHRFAATFVCLPDATMWAYADAALVAQVVDRSVPFAEVADHYRGCAGLDGGKVQALERSVLAAAGWDVLDRRRRGYDTGEPAGPDGATLVRLEVDDGRGGLDVWEGTVAPGRTLPVPGCMKPISEAKKTETEWAVGPVRLA